MIQSLLRELRGMKPYLCSQRMYEVHKGTTIIHCKHKTDIEVMRDNHGNLVICKVEPNYNTIYVCSRLSWAIVNEGTLLCLRMKVSGRWLSMQVEL